MKARLERKQLNSIICDAIVHRNEFQRRNKFPAGRFGGLLDSDPIAAINLGLSSLSSDTNLYPSDRYYGYYWMAESIVNKIILNRSEEKFDYELYSKAFLAGCEIQAD